MNEKKCFRCLRSEKVVRLLDAIYGNEIARVCEQCALVEDIPVIRRPSSFQLKESDRSYTVLERLSRMAGVPTKVDPRAEEKLPVLTLDKLRKPKDYSEVLRQREERAKKRNQPIGLIDNYNWHIQKARRDRKMSLAQLGGVIGESEMSLKMIEDNILPDDADKIISKIEQYFKINLRKQARQPVQQINRLSIQQTEIKTPARILRFDSSSMKALTISDLQKMKVQKEALAKEEADKELASQLAWQGKSKEERKVIKENVKTQKNQDENKQVEPESIEEKKSKKSFWDVFKRKKVDEDIVNIE